MQPAAVADAARAAAARRAYPVEFALEGTVAFASNGRAGCVSGSRTRRALSFLFEDGATRPLPLDEVVAAAAWRVER